MLSYLYDDISKVLQELRTTKEGLSDIEVTDRQKKYGPNVLVENKRTSLILSFLKQFTDLLIIILIAAAIFSTLIGSYKDSVVIILIIFINTFIGFVQEHKAEKTISALSSHLPQTVTVIRESVKKKIEASNLVIGDVVYLSEGDKVSADIRLISANELYTNDSTITGESEPQEKSAMESESKNIELMDLKSSLFAGTQIISGNGIGAVIATGMSSQLGRIASETTKVRTVKSPLQKETDHIAKIVAKSFIFVILALLVAHYFIVKYFNLSEGLLFAVQIAAAIVPEGLPATISVALAIGARRMAKRKAAIKRLSTVETLGEINVIVTDKTGTLTKNEMTVKDIYCNDKIYSVTGSGYGNGGEILYDEMVLFPKDKLHLKKFFDAGIFANNSDINYEKPHGFEYIGDPTEVSILVAAEKYGINTFKVREKAIVTEEIPFTSERKFMAKVIKEKGGETVYFKGATHSILEMCDKIYTDGRITKISAKDIHHIKHITDEFSSRALRVIACAYKKKDGKDLENGLIFLGLYGIIDPPRPDIKETIRIARNAGIRTVMVTGDHGLTAAAIAQRVGLHDNPKVINGSKLNTLNDKELSRILCDEDVIFARVDPMHKLRIVRVLQKMHNIVAVTGDGVNDSPALKSSDVGIAMGISGTDVSRESSDMVILNDSYSSIVWAIKEGRIVYDNIEKFTKFEFTTHVAALSTVTAGIIMGVMPLFAIQILLMDYGAETFSAFALGVDTEEDDVMVRPPRDRKVPLLNTKNLFYVLRTGIGLSVIAVSVFLYFMISNGWRFGKVPGTEILFTATAITYATFAVGQIFNSFSIRSKSKPLHKLFFGNPNLIYAAIASLIFIIGIVYTPTLNGFAKMAPIPPNFWVIIIGAGFIFATYLELIKFGLNKFSKKN